MAAKSHIIEWEHALSLKSRYELQYIIDHPEGYTPEFLKMAKAKLAEFSDMPDNEAMREVLNDIAPYERTYKIRDTQYLHEI